MTDLIPAKRPTRSETRQRLIDAATELFETEGRTDIRVEAICARAGFTRGAFYSNFKTVEDVFYALYETQNDKVERHLIAAFASWEPPAGDQQENVADALSELLGKLTVDSHWLAIRTLFLSRAFNQADVASHMQQHSESLREHLQGPLVAFVQRAGRDLQIDPETFCRAVIAANAGASSQAPLYEDWQTVRAAAIRGVVLGLTCPSPGTPEGQ